MFSRFFTVSLALATLSEPAFAESPMTTPGMQLQLGGSAAYGTNRTKEENDIEYDYKGLFVGGFVNLGYLFRRYAFSVDLSLGMTSLEESGPDGDSKSNAFVAFFLTNRWVLPLNEQFAIVPHLGVGMYYDAVAAKVGSGVDYAVSDNLYLTTELSYIPSSHFIDLSQKVQVQIGVGMKL